MIKLPLVDRVKFFVERQFVKGAGFQLLVVAFVIGAISVLGGAAIVMAGSDMTLPESIWWAFLRLTDPGYLGDDQGTWRRIVSTGLTVSGYVVFMGTLVAIMTRWLIAKMLEFERGLTPVAMRNHIVIIGWTSRTIPLLRELLGTGGSRRRFLAAFGTRRLRAVVLSEEVSPLQAQALQSDPAIARGIARDVVLRYGSVLEEEAIRRAACLSAAAVIMPAGYGSGSRFVGQDVETTRGLLSMDARAARVGEAPPLVVAEIQDGRRLPMVESAYRGPLEVIPSDDTISRLLVQSVLHPGLSAFLDEVLTAGDGNEIYLRPAGALAGATLRDVAARCPKAVVLGLVRELDGGLEPMLDAPSTEKVLAGDRLALLARSYAETEPVASAAAGLAPIERPAPAAHRHASREPVRLLMLGWGRRVPSLIAELAGYPAMNFEVDVVSMIEPDLREREIRRYSPACERIPVRQIEADYLFAGELGKLDLEAYRTVLLLSSDQLESAEEADARVIVGQRILETLLAGRARRPQVLMELSDAANAGVAQTASAETLVTPLILSHVMAQIALRREMRVLFDELFTEGGAEIEFRPATHYAASGARTFAALEARVSARGDTLLGVRTGVELRLNPPRETVFESGDDDRLCVLTKVSGR